MIHPKLAPAQRTVQHSGLVSVRRSKALALAYKVAVVVLAVMGLYKRPDQRAVTLYLRPLSNRGTIRGA